MEPAPGLLRSQGKGPERIAELAERYERRQALFSPDQQSVDMQTGANLLRLLGGLPPPDDATECRQAEDCSRPRGREQRLAAILGAATVAAAC